MALELVHGKPGAKNFAELDLSPSTWEQLVKLGESQEWKRETQLSVWFYWDSPQNVPKTEALAWADALERAMEVPELKNAELPKFLKQRGKDGTEAALVDPNYSRFRGLSREMVERFVQFLRKGEFIYALWD
jgi:hypothetical protein